MGLWDAFQKAALPQVEEHGDEERSYAKTDSGRGWRNVGDEHREGVFGVDRRRCRRVVDRLDDEVVAAVVLGPGSILTSSKVGASFGFPALAVLALLVNDRIIQLWVLLLLGEPLPTWRYWLAPLVGMAVWPWLFLAMDQARLASRQAARPAITNARLVKALSGSAQTPGPSRSR